MGINKTLLINCLRLVCVAIFFGSTFTFTFSITTTSILTILLFIGTFLLPQIYRKPLAVINHVVEEKFKTKDIVSTLYPPLLPTELQEKVYREVTKFVTYDTENTQVLERFTLIKNNSDCLFAKKAKLWGSPSWLNNLSIEENIYRLIPMFIKFTIVLTTYKLDGFVIELPGEMYATSIERFGDSFRQVLQTLSDNDPSGSRCMDKSYIDKRGWVFEFNKITFFITTFAPFYSKNNPRFAHGASDSYILFQPELSFAFHDLPSDTPETNWEHPRTVRDQIRVAFKAAGRGYTIPDTIYHPMVEEMIRPINNQDGIYKWWRKD